MECWRSGSRSRSVGPALVGLFRGLYSRAGGLLCAGPQLRLGHHPADFGHARDLASAVHKTDPIDERDAEDPARTGEAAGEAQGKPAEAERRTDALVQGAWREPVRGLRALGVADA